MTITEADGPDVIYVDGKETKLSDVVSPLEAEKGYESYVYKLRN
ncbi:hypothetical protein [Tenacibaculum maritimum]|nr:hypothetical protein [Tenacibaculum maritimum]